MYKKYFDILNLNENSTLEQVQSSYKNLVEFYTSQLENSESNADTINQKILEVNSAYDYLINNFFSKSSSNARTLSLAQIRELINSDRLNEAKEHLWKIEDKKAEWHFLMGQLYQKEGWYDRSETHFKMACNLEPNNFEYNQAYRSFQDSNSQFRQTYYKRTGMGNNQGCCGGLCCDTCCTLFCIDTCCEACGCDFISCC